MKALKLSQLDYRYILIQNYKELGLSENELVVLLLIDTLNKEKPCLFTGDQLEVKMNLKAKEIDQTMVDLMNKGFISYETIDGIMVTSINSLYDKIVCFVKEQILKLENEEEALIQEDALRNTLKIIEEEMKRPLTPLEIEAVSSWFKEGVSENVIMSAINECIVKHSRVSVKLIDRLIIKKLQYDDKVQEGATTVDEKTKKDLRKAMDIVAYDWVNDK